MEYLQYVYGLLKGRIVYYTVYSTDRKLLNNWHRQITPNYRKIAYITVQVENSRKAAVELSRLI